jgi:hypothetical protein
MWNGLFKLVGTLILIFALYTLYAGHYKHMRNVQASKSTPVSYHYTKKQLVCDGVVIAEGNIRYEDRATRGNSISNSNGIWKVNGGVYVQKQGSLCELK